MVAFGVINKLAAFKINIYIYYLAYFSIYNFLKFYILLDISVRIFVLGSKTSKIYRDRTGDFYIEILPFAKKKIFFFLNSNYNYKSIDILVLY